MNKDLDSVRLTELSIEVLSPLEILNKSKTMSLLVTPNTRESRSVSQRADRIFPVPVSCVCQPLEHIASRESYDRWVELEQSFGKIDTETILSALEGRWEQADQVEVKIPSGSALDQH